MVTITLIGGDEFGIAGALRRALSGHPRVLLAPLALPAAQWPPAARQARTFLGRRVVLPRAGRLTEDVAQATAVLIPGGCPAVAAAHVAPVLAVALLDTTIVASSAGAMLLGQRMAASCPDARMPCALVPGLGLVEGVVSPHAEALDSVWLDALRRLVPPRPWLRLASAETMMVATARPPRLVPPAMSSTDPNAKEQAHVIAARQLRRRVHGSAHQSARARAPRAGDGPVGVGGRHAARRLLAGT